MKNSIIWKLVLTAIVAGWSLWNLFPITETPFPEYIADAATAHQAEFRDLLAEAHQKAEAEENATVFTALRGIANQRGIDLHKYFQNIRLEEGIRNIPRRNELLLNELLRRSRASIPLGLDLRGGVSFTLEFQDWAADISILERQEMMSKAIEILRTRADGLGVAEPLIRPVGDNRIEVQLPGITTRDNPDILAVLQRPARLEFRLVHPTLSGPVAEDEVPPGYQILTQQIEDPQTGDLFDIPHVVRRRPVLTGDAIARAHATFDEFGGHSVELNFTAEGGDRFADITREMADDSRATSRARFLAIVLDGVLYSAPRVHEEIPGGRATITGRFSQREAIELANVLNNPLDAALEPVEQYEVGPTLAEDAISAARFALIIGGLAVVVFMILYYLVSGLAAAMTLCVNVVIILGVLASLGATLTLPGIAGIILTIGMAVDANILIFERFREELKQKKTLKTALSTGYQKTLSSILDANITTLMTAAILIIFGAGPIQGFGITLAIGIFTSVFGALIITRLILEAAIAGGIVKSLPMQQFIKPSSIPFLKYRKPAFIASWTIIAIGILAIAIKGDRIYGIDFAGGDEVRLTFTERLPTAEIERVSAENDLGEVVPVYRQPIGGGTELLTLQTRFEMGNRLVSSLQEEFPQANLQVVGESHVGPAVGDEIRNDAIIALWVVMIGVLLYVALRFEWGYGFGAVIALAHDVLMTIGIFVLSGRQFSAPMVAGILMVVGYSINDTIVTFDRIRELLQLDPNSKLKDIINGAINQVLSRTLLTSATTLVATIPLVIFASGVVADFAFIFLIGIITGTFSSIFIASPVFYWWHKGDRRHVEERRDILPKYDWAASSKASE